MDEITAIAGRSPAVRPVLDLVVPVHDEEGDLAPCVRELRRQLDTALPFPSIVTIADNASTDSTWEIACQLVNDVPGVRALRLPRQGRGGALRAAWTRSEAEIVAYTDVDLSTNLNALLPLVAPIVSGHSDLAIGSRLATGARVSRGPKRELISRSYNLLLRLVLGNEFSDAQCGFKAMRADKAALLLPAVRDGGWFFDTELLVLAERNGLRIHEVPVDWTDDPDSRVAIGKTALADLRGVLRMLAQRARHADRLANPASRRDRAEPGWLRLLAVVVVLLLAAPLWALSGGGAAAGLLAALLAVGVARVGGSLGWQVVRRASTLRRLELVVVEQDEPVAQDEPERPSGDGLALSAASSTSAAR